MLEAIDHVGIRVEDAARSVAFYTEVLGMRVRERVQRPTVELIFLELGGQVVELIAGAHGDIPERGRVDHLAFKVKNLEDAMAEIAAKSPGMNFTDIFDGGNGWRVTFFTGPDNERLELVERRS